MPVPHTHPQFRFSPIGVKWETGLELAPSGSLLCPHCEKPWWSLTCPSREGEGPEEDLDPGPNAPTQALGSWQKEEQLGYWQEGIAGWGRGCAWGRVFRGS